MGWIVSLPISVCWSPNASTPDCIWTEGFKELPKLKWGHSRVDQTSLEVGVIWTRHTQREDHIKRKGNDRHLQAKNRSLRRNLLWHHPDLGLSPSELWPNKFLFKPQTVILSYGSTSKLIPLILVLYTQRYYKGVFEKSMYSWIYAIYFCWANTMFSANALGNADTIGNKRDNVNSLFSGSLIIEGKE